MSILPMPKGFPKRKPPMGIPPIVNPPLPGQIKIFPKRKKGTIFTEKPVDLSGLDQADTAAKFGKFKGRLLAAKNMR